MAFGLGPPSSVNVSIMAQVGSYGQGTAKPLTTIPNYLEPRDGPEVDKIWPNPSKSTR